MKSSQSPRHEADKEDRVWVLVGFRIQKRGTWEAGDNPQAHLGTLQQALTTIHNCKESVSQELQNIDMGLIGLMIYRSRAASSQQSGESRHEQLHSHQKGVVGDKKDAKSESSSAEVA